MKVKKHPQLNKNLASTLPSVQLLGTLFGILFVLGFPVVAAQDKEITTPKTFADWCLNKTNLSVETLRTVREIAGYARIQSILLWLQVHLDRGKSDR